MIEVVSEVFALFILVALACVVIVFITVAATPKHRSRDSEDIINRFSYMAVWMFAISTVLLALAGSPPPVIGYLTGTQ